MEVISIRKGSSNFKFMVFDNETKRVCKVTGDEDEANQWADATNEKLARVDQDN